MRVVRVPDVPPMVCNQSDAKETHHLTVCAQTFTNLDEVPHDLVFPSFYYVLTAMCWECMF